MDATPSLKHYSEGGQRLEGAVVLRCVCYLVVGLIVVFVLLLCIVCVVVCVFVLL